MNRSSQITVVIGLFLAQFCHAADPLDIWTERSPFPTGSNLSSAAYGNGQFVVVGWNSAIATSIDGTNWTQRTRPNDGASPVLHGAVYGNNQFVVVGDQGTILYSPDGNDWIQRSSGELKNLSSITYGNGQYVAVGDFGTVLTSPDGINWTARNSGTSYRLNGIAHGNGLFVVVASNGSVFTSTNGSVWVPQASGTTNSLYGITFGNGEFVAVGGGYTSGTGFFNIILISPDGINWTPSNSATSSVALISVAFVNGMFVAGSHGSSTTNPILTSTDAVAWIAHSSGAANGLRGISYGNGQFVVVGDYGTILTSEDGNTWASRKTIAGDPLFGITYGNNIFVAVGDRSIITSPDGIGWIRRNPNASIYTFLEGVTYGNGLFVAVGEERTAEVLTSKDGINWSLRWRAEGGLGMSHLSSIAAGNGLFVATGYYDVLPSYYSKPAFVSSVDGINWTPHALVTTNALRDITYGNGLFVAAGSYGTVFTSGDGSNWIAHASGVTNTLNSITYGNGQFVAGGYDDYTTASPILISSDGISWQSHDATNSYGGYLWPSRIRYENGLFVLLGSGIYTSLDGITWSQRYYSSYFGGGVAYGNGHYLVVGDSILESGQFEPQGPSIVTPPRSQTVQAGANIVLSVTATGTPQPNFQWRKNGVNIPGATSATLTMNSVTAADSDCYSVLIWNDFGSTVSDGACLAVLTDGANGKQPTQILAPPGPTQPTGVDSLVIVTHGWEPLGPFADISWITDMAKAIQARVPANYVVMPFDWMGAAWFPDPDLTLISGAGVGHLYAKLRLVPQHWRHVHLIAHSAGSAVIEAMAQELKSSPNPPVIHETFLDPYTSVTSLTGRGVYGANADWADNYSARGAFLDAAPALLGVGNSTVGKLDYAFNADVGWVGTNHWTVPFGNGQIALASHGWPIAFYIETITNSNPSWCVQRYGFPLSKEGSGWTNNSVNYPIGLDPTNLCGAQVSVQNPTSQPTYTQVLFDGLAHAVSSGVSVVGGWFTLSSGSSQLRPQLVVKQSGIKPQGPSTNNVGTSAWLAMGLPVTNAANFVTFDAGFTSTEAAEGLLTVYWNTNEIGMVDERVASPGPQTYRFALPATVTNGLYTLSFRLDAFNNTSSSITVKNLATVFVGVLQPITLGASLNKNETPVLQLTGTPGYNYLLQSSTNLVDWTPAALMLNTNGTVLFADPTVTNSGARFYRAVMPF